MGWFTDVSFLLPNWAWLVIALIVVAFIIAVVALCIKYAGKEKTAENLTDSPKSEADKEAKAEESPEERQSEDDSVKEEKPVAAEGVADKANTEKQAEDKTVQKPATSPAAKQDGAEKKPVNKVYHISKRKDDNKWQVKAAKGAKAIKLFSTQAEAIDFAKALAESQDARIVIHKEDGSFRNLTYKKK